MRLYWQNDETQFLMRLPHSSLQFCWYTMEYKRNGHILLYATLKAQFPFLVNYRYTSFPKKNTVFPLNGYLTTDSDDSVISTPQTKILLAKK